MKYLPLVFVVLAEVCLASQAGEQPKTSPESLEQKNNAAREMLQGEWCGSKTYPNGARQQWVVNRHEDGTYRIDFLTNHYDETESWSEIGIWGVRFPVYFTATRGFVDEKGQYPAKTTKPDLYEAYQIDEVSEDSFSYISFRSGNRYRITRNCEL
ncbi:hypothetical protein ACWJJH_03645 [Endozoicomonadaceae bacterium StTr2]